MPFGLFTLRHSMRLPVFAFQSRCMAAQSLRYPIQSLMPGFAWNLTLMHLSQAANLSGKAGPFQIMRGALDVFDDTLGRLVTVHSCLSHVPLLRVTMSQHHSLINYRDLARHVLTSDTCVSALFNGHHSLACPCPQMRKYRGSNRTEAQVRRANHKMINPPFSCVFVYRWE